MGRMKPTIPASFDPSPSTGGLKRNGTLATSGLYFFISKGKVQFRKFFCSFFSFHFYSSYKGLKTFVQAQNIIFPAMIIIKLYDGTMTMVTWYITYLNYSREIFFICCSIIRKSYSLKSIAINWFNLTFFWQRFSILIY